MGNRLGPADFAFKPGQREAAEARQKALDPATIAKKEQDRLAEEAAATKKVTDLELATTQAAILGGVGAAKKNRRRPGSIMTSGATDSTIGYGPVGNRKTLLGF